MSSFSFAIFLSCPFPQGPPTISHTHPNPCFGLLRSPFCHTTHRDSNWGNSKAKTKARAEPWHFYRTESWDQGTAGMPTPRQARSPTGETKVSQTSSRPRGANPKEKAIDGEAAYPCTPAVFW